MKFGCHLSIKGGYSGAAKSALAMGADAFQYFPKNPRSLSVKSWDRVDAALCRSLSERNGFISVSHSPYPTILTSHKREKREQVIQSLLNDLEITEACGSLGVVVHFGKPDPHLPLLDSYRLIIGTLNDILGQWTGKAIILLENSAGLPGTFGTTLEELVKIRQLCDDPGKVGFCLDTCHAYASGLWDGNNWVTLYDKGSKLGFWEALKVVHLNNSKYGPREGKDRHAPIFSGGFIRESQFDSIMGTSEFQSIPFILETPKDTHKREINLLQKKWK